MTTLALRHLVEAAGLLGDPQTPKQVAREAGLYRALLVPGALVVEPWEPERLRVCLGWGYVAGVSKRPDDHVCMSAGLAPGPFGAHVLCEPRASLVLDDAAELRLCPLLARAIGFEVADGDRWELVPLGNAWSLAQSHGPRHITWKPRGERVGWNPGPGIHAALTPQPLPPLLTTTDRGPVLHALLLAHAAQLVEVLMTPAGATP